MLTLMAVHAHPDDEATSTGGILARYAGEGIRTVVVTCTDGALGDAVPGEELTAVRRGELEQSCRILGVSHLETLGYRDSGMMGAPTNDAPGSFWSMPVQEAAVPLAALMQTYRPDVVVTYDEVGFYGHPDHIAAHRITLAALEAAGCTAKLYYSTVRRSAFARFGEVMREAGSELPDDLPDMGVEDDEVGASIDCRDQAPAKFAALSAHASQQDAALFLQLPMARFTELFAVEDFVRVHPPRARGAEVETDLFAGLR